MGRSYYGDIEGNFWNVVQGSDDAEFFGGVHDYVGYDGEVVEDDDEAVGILFQFDQDDFEDIQNGIATCLKHLGEYQEPLDNFFQAKSSYDEEEIAKELQIPVDKVGKLLTQYARLILGLKIEHCVGENGECNFTAELR